MLRLITSLIAVTFLASQPAFAEEAGDSNFAPYSVNVGGSPFGGSLSFGYNESPKTSWLFSVGGGPGLTLEPEIEGIKYTVNRSSSWVGCFVSHRPLANADWFRLVAGLGFGNMKNELEEEWGNHYRADYTGNLVGYLGVGFGARPVKGFDIGLDIGWLQTAGPDVSHTKLYVNEDNLCDQCGPHAGLCGYCWGNDPVEDIFSHFLFGVLPNVQLTVAWGF